MKAAAKLERYKAQGKEEPYIYKGFLETQAAAITSIVVASTTLTLVLDPVEGNPAHVSIEMVMADGAQDGKNVRNAVKDKLVSAFGHVITPPAGN
jgi:hypothetical protein